MQTLSSRARFAWIVVAGILAGGIVAMLPGCGGDAKPVAQPAEPPPLPPASGTPIGYLIDDASELALRDDQLVQLKAIDDDLAGRLAALEPKGHAAAPAAAATPMAGARRGSRHGGGRHRGGGGAGSARTPATGSAGTDAASHTTEVRADDVRDALARAFTVLDPAQQETAKRVLSDRGVDLDAGRPTAPDAGSGVE